MILDTNKILNNDKNKKFEKTKRRSGKLLNELEKKHSKGSNLNEMYIKVMLLHTHKGSY